MLHVYMSSLALMFHILFLIDIKHLFGNMYNFFIVDHQQFVIFILLCLLPTNHTQNSIKPKAYQI